MRCAGAQQRGHTTVETDIVNNMTLKKALLTWRLADIHDVCATRNLKLYYDA